MPRSRSRLTRRARLLLAVLPIAVVAGVLIGLRQPAIALDADGPADEVVNAEQLADLEFTASVDDAALLEEAVLTLDGTDVTDLAVVEGSTLRFAPGELDDGERELHLAIPQRFPSRDAQTSWRFTVDATPPELAISEPDDVVFGNEAAALAGTASGAEAVEVDGDPVDLGADGAFGRDYDSPPSEPVQVVARDAAGNETVEEVTFAVVRSRVEVDEPRAVHVSFYGWASPALREPVLEMAREGRINSVQFDLKDESGTVGYDSQVPLAREIGAVDPINDLEAAVDELHEMGVHVSGRIVAFRDPILAAWAWENGERDWVLQTPSGEAYGGYGGFTNFSHDDVREYNIDIAREAAAAGVDDILYDYVRRPDGPLENLVIPGLEGTPEEAIVEFTRRSKEAIEPYRAKLGLSVYGIAATRPTQIAQDIEALAPYCDYVAPMLYPSHWGAGEFAVADPNRQPYDIIFRSLEDFLMQVEGTDCKVFPWLEDTNYRAYDRKLHVEEQIRATRDWGIGGWIMWDPLVQYTTSAYEPNPADPPAPERRPGEDRDPEVERAAENAG